MKTTKVKHKPNAVRRWHENEKRIEAEDAKQTMLFAEGLAQRIDKAGKVSINVTIKLFAGELVTFCRKAIHERKSLDQVVSEFFESDGCVSDFLRNYENTLEDEP